MSTDALRAAMMDRSGFEIGRLEAAEGALDIGELLVGGNRRGGIEVFGIKVSSHDIDAIEHGLGGALFAAFSVTLTTQPFGPRRLRWFAACSCKPVAGGRPPSLT